MLERDREAHFPRPIWKALGHEGLFRLILPIRHGGLGQGLPELVSALEGLGAGSLDLPFGVSAVAQVIAVELLSRFGNDEQLAQHLPGLASGDQIAAICNSEPGSGTDLKAIRSSVKLIGEGMGIASIRKRGATNLSQADLLFCSAWRQEPEAKPTLEVYLLDAAECRQESHVSQLMGFRTGLTGSMEAPGTLLSVHQRQLGERLTGFEILRYCFNLERVLVAAVMAGVLDGLITEALSGIATMSSFGKPLSEHQYIQDKVVQLHSAKAKIQGLIASVIGVGADPVALARHSDTLAVLKLSVIEDAHVALVAFFEVFGFPSYTLEHFAQKAIKDQMALRFLGGSKEQQKILLFNSLLAQAMEASSAQAARSAPKAQPAEPTAKPIPVVLAAPWAEVVSGKGTA